MEHRVESLGRGQLETVIKPSKTPERIGLAALPVGLPKHFTRDALGVIELPDRARLQRNARGTQITRVLVPAESRFVVSIRRVDAFGKAEPVLDRHAGALRERLQRRMRGVA